MQAKHKDYITQAFVLDSVNLQKIADSISSLLGAVNISISARCVDKIERKFASVADALAYENPPTRAISSLTLCANSEHWRFSVLLCFNSDVQQNIQINFQGDEDSVLKLNQAITDRLSAMRPWYWFVAQNVTQTSMFLFLWCVYAFFSITKSLFRYIGIDGLIVQIIILSLILFIILVYVAGLLNSLKNYVFPMAVFALGQGEKRHADMNTIRTVIVASFFVSILASIATSFLI